MDEYKLSKGFEWTTKAYQARYAEVYSDCTCWYCGAVRSGGPQRRPQQERRNQSAPASRAPARAPLPKGAQAGPQEGPRAAAPGAVLRPLGCLYYMYSPAAYPMHLTPGLYPGWDPGAVSTGTGSWPDCATGSYGGAGVSLFPLSARCPFFLLFSSSVFFFPL